MSVHSLCLPGSSRRGRSVCPCGGRRSDGDDGVVGLSTGTGAGGWADGRRGGGGCGEGRAAGEPQARLVGQQPPPRLAGQDWKPEVQLKGLWTTTGAVVGVEVVVGALEVGDVVEGEIVLDDKLDLDDDGGLIEPEGLLKPKRLLSMQQEGRKVRAWYRSVRIFLKNIAICSCSTQHLRIGSLHPSALVREPSSMKLPVVQKEHLPRVSTHFPDTNRCLSRQPLQDFGIPLNMDSIFWEVFCAGWKVVRPGRLRGYRTWRDGDEEKEKDAWQGEDAACVSHLW
ncbi:hypothetical protein H2199_004966 [Coniosporium tulheliwenetii]|uniref:Uncharacterized protein n=1 Tax=Coniosporium tulheliwenetii TaxID=3383036 RepID=A0ACC2Z4V3_9PEZI|nr:hypothetical protein H2199_004966 [Cladosporium sp. JES 115]